MERAKTAPVIDFGGVQVQLVKVAESRRVRLPWWKLEQAEAGTCTLRRIDYDLERWRDPRTDRLYAVERVDGQVHAVVRQRWHPYHQEPMIYSELFEAATPELRDWFLAHEEHLERGWALNEWSARLEAERERERAAAGEDRELAAAGVRS